MGDIGTIYRSTESGGMMNLDFLFLINYFYKIYFCFLIFCNNMNSKLWQHFDIFITVWIFRL
jgi:hypothetical protein